MGTDEGRGRAGDAPTDGGRSPATRTSSVTREYLRRLHTGDPEALPALVEYLRPRIVAEVRRRMSRRQRERCESLDVVQQLIVDFLRRSFPITVDDRDVLARYVTRCISHKLADQRRGFHYSMPSCEGCEPLDLQGGPSPEPSPEDAAVSNEEQGLVYVALSYLPTIDRRLMILRHVEDLPWEECGKVLGLRADAARMRSERAKARLKRSVRILRQRGLAGLEPPEAASSGA